MLNLIKKNWYYFLWIPVMLLGNFLYCYIAVKFNQVDFLRTYLYMVLCGAIPTWSLATYWSRNLIFDGLLYDSLLIISSPFLLMLFGQAENFDLINWIGVATTFLGLILVKMKWPIFKKH